MDTLGKDALIAAQGMDVVDLNGERIGSIEDVYYDDATGAAEWVGIGTGIFGLKRRVVPVEGARLEDACLRVPYDKEVVKDSPDVDDDAITAEREADLYAYYGLTSSAGLAADARTGGRIGSDLESSPVDEAMGTVGGPSGRLPEERPMGADLESGRVDEPISRPLTSDQDEPIYGDEARIGAGASDVGMRAPELDLERAEQRQTGDDLMERGAGRSRLRRWSPEVREGLTGDEGDVPTNPVTGQPRR